MAEYVKRDAVLKIVEQWQKIDIYGKHLNDDTPIYSAQDWQDWKTEFYMDLVNEINDLPTEDLIFCKDCIYNYNPLADCCPMDFVCADKDFCSWADRRKNDRF